MADGAAAGGYVLPAVAGRPVDKGGHMDLGGRRLPADIAHIGTAGEEGVGMEYGKQEIIQTLSPIIALFGREGSNLFGISAAVTGRHMCRAGRAQPVGEGFLFFCKRRQAGFQEVLIQQVFQGKAGDQFRSAVNKDSFKGGLCHQSSAFRDFVYSCQQFDGIPDLVGPDHVEDGGVVLNYIGGNSAGVGDGVMDSAVTGHMLPQILDAGIHQLHRVQGAPAVPGITCRVGGNALEFIKDLDTGIIGPRYDLIDIRGMPGQGRVQIPPQAVSGHEGFACTAFFTGTAKKEDGPFPAGFFQIIFDGKGCGQGSRAQHVVAAAVAGSSFL